MAQISHEFDWLCTTIQLKCDMWHNAYIVQLLPGISVPIDSLTRAFLLQSRDLVVQPLEHRPVLRLQEGQRALGAPQLVDGHVRRSWGRRRRRRRHCGFPDLNVLGTSLGGIHTCGTMSIFLIRTTIFTGAKNFVMSFCEVSPCSCRLA